MTIRNLLLAASAVLLLSAPLAVSTPSFAQATKPTVQTPQVAQTPKSLECSKLANDRGLKGKARKKFRNACKKGQTPPA